MKKLSIVIPSYNNKMISKALDSIVPFINEEIEVVVIDGLSNQDVIEIIKQYDEYIDTFICEKDKGIYDAFNKGVRYATGEWIFVLASDDELLINPLQVIKKYSFENADLICGHVILNYNDEDYGIMTSNKNLKKLNKYCSLRHPATMFRKETYDKYGYYDDSLKCDGDRDLFLKFRDAGAKVKIVDEYVTLFRWGGTSTQTGLWNMFKEDVIVTKKYGGNGLMAIMRAVYGYVLILIENKFHFVIRKTRGLNMNLEQVKKLVGNNQS